MSPEELYMNRCLQLARLGAGAVLPNPMVGAVLVHDNRIIGEGYHKFYGGPHAEPNCINSVHASLQHQISSSTLYVSLEPCSHFGKTPPCADLIIRFRIPRVVIGCRDIFDKVNGRGIEKLIAAGVDVHTGVLEAECRDQNKRFFTLHGKKRPYVVLKWAETGNGKIGYSGTNRLRITGRVTDMAVHKWRSEEGAIMVGTTTARHDNPRLTNRHWYGPSPVRVVIDKELSLPSDLHLFDQKVNTIIYNSLRNAEDSLNSYQQADLTENGIRNILENLASRNISSLMVEGGARLTQSFIESGYWDEARIITNESMIVEVGVAAPQLKDHVFVKEQSSGQEKIRYYRHLQNVG
ncbi:MAG TPA: bifunctional diaminohydroxyphosphoribosylaminopyrimidine deaminase/5-amino-6-(5-phosphoribosylamino)uracil reductase RibD [Flavitalea sp.]|nr:bifunctional diaminohydroxyphosphoribosylaminopyrimidine deaminase/5-amino-6-(5-phosphoribosylamino)uracil reductase RibD [Flavitalea sp.]